MSGHDASNTRSQPLETRISTANVKTLITKWSFTTGGDVSSTPAVADGVVYFPDWQGNLYALRAESGQMIWSRKISSYTGFNGAVARVSPAIFGDTLILGDNIAQGITEHPGASMFAVDRATGALRWITRVDAHPAAIITGQPVVNNGVVYVGVSSNEEALASNDNYTCCTFRGSVVALDAGTGRMKWQLYTSPENGGQPFGYSGNAVWQPPAVDEEHGLLYIGTGNNYTVPEAVKVCQAAPIAPDQTHECSQRDNYFNSAMALDLKTGAPVWVQRVSEYDTWTVACNSNTPRRNCATPAGPDYDFGGSGPNLLPGFIGFGQKSGVYWALNPVSGDVVWNRFVGPGGTLGGIEWGSAADGKRIYVAIGNNGHKAYKLASGANASGGSWAALDIATGKIMWQVADPAGAIDTGAVSVANGVVFAGSYSGAMYALDAATGAMLWTFNSGGSVISSPAIVNGTVFWGSGYRKISPGTGNNKMYAFGLP